MSPSTSGFLSVSIESTIHFVYSFAIQKVDSWPSTAGSSLETKPHHTSN